MATSASGARKAPAKKAAGTRSGNPAKRASAARTAEVQAEARSTGTATPTSARAWRKAYTEDLTLPSGNVAKCKRPGPAVLLQNGVLADSLGPIVTEAIRSKQGLKPEQIERFNNDPEALVQMLDGMDRVLAEVVVEPAVRYHRVQDDEGAWHTIPEDERDYDAFVYTDEVDMDDKVFIFQFAVGGTRDWERFRRESSALVGNLGAGEGDGGSPE